MEIQDCAFPLVVMMSGQILRFCVGERGDGETGPVSELCSWLSGVDKTIPAWSGCVRLVKRWVASQLLSSIPTTAIEVSVATVLSSSPHTPSSPTPAFLLWLHTMATHDWNYSPLTYPGCAPTPPRPHSGQGQSPGQSFRDLLTSLLLLFHLPPLLIYSLHLLPVMKH